MFCLASFGILLMSDTHGSHRLGWFLSIFSMVFGIVAKATIQLASISESASTDLPNMTRWSFVMKIITALVLILMIVHSWNLAERIA
jgi:hypothetical protein